MKGRPSGTMAQISPPLNGLAQMFGYSNETLIENSVHIAESHWASGLGSL